MESVTESKQTTPGGLAYTLSGLSLLFAILCSVWTYIAWLSNSSILDFARLQLFLTHHGDVLSSLGAFSSGLAAILLAHELGHALMAQDDFDGPPFGFQHLDSSFQVWVGCKRLKPPCYKESGLARATRTSTWRGGFALLSTYWTIHPLGYALYSRDRLSSQALLIQLLGHLGLGLELNAIQVAGWMGLLLSSLQLLPIGATDGGQVLRTLLPRIHLPVSLLALFALTLFAFSMPMKVAMTWWVWAGFSVLHLFGNPVKVPQIKRGLGNQLLLASLWLPL